MPTGNLPSEGKKLYEKVYQDRLKACKGKGGSDDKCQESAAKQAWSAVKGAGWKKVGDKWVKSAQLQEFSLSITKASFDPATKERRWRGQASDIFADSFGDNMTQELFDDFQQRIEKREIVPEEFRSDYWEGGMPYLSISHYPDLDGEGVPGSVDSLFVDGEYLKSKGKVFDTPLGEQVWQALKKDMATKRSDPVRISIAFLDWSHKHKGSGFIFERGSLEDICPECLRELLEGEYNGREFLKGQLVHLALTRVPVNQRTIMEVDRSMTTRKEDAESIIGDLAEDLDEKAKLIGRSEALIIKADEEPETEEVVEEEPEKVETETPEPVVEDAKHSMKDEEECEEGDEECMKRMKEKKMKEKKSKVAPDLAPVLQAIDELKTLLAPPQPHVLDKAFLHLKAEFDAIRSGEGTLEEKLTAMQGAANMLGEEIRARLKEEVAPEVAEEDRLMQLLSRVVKPLQDQIADLQNKMRVAPDGVPVQRSYAQPPNYKPPQPTLEPGAPMKIDDFARKSVG